MWVRWEAIAIAAVITLSVDAAGVLIVFVFLVAPAIVEISITDRLAGRLLIGWGLGLCVTVLGLLASYVWDLPTGPAIIGPSHPRSRRIPRRRCRIQGSSVARNHSAQQRLGRSLGHGCALAC